MVSDSVSVLSANSTSPQWGIFDQNGEALIAAESVIDFDFAKEFRILDYPVEGGSFKSYNKVERPGDIRMKFACGSGDPTSALSNRTEFLASIGAALTSLSLYSVVTPEATYPNYNVVHYDYRREAKNGVTLIVADIWLNEVRLPPAAQFVTVNGQQQSTTSAQVPTSTPTSANGSSSSGGGSNGLTTKSPSAASPVSNGTVQPQPLTPSAMAGLSTGPNPMFTVYNSQGSVGTIAGTSQADLPAAFQQMQQNNPEFGPLSFTPPASGP